MGLSIGIVGLPNVGKSTTFNALTKAQNAEAANYPFCTIEPNKAVVPVPDSRLDELAKIVNPQKIQHSVVEFVDIAGLVRGASKGEGLGNQFLANIKEADMILHIVRCFEDSNITHVEGRIDPISDIESEDGLESDNEYVKKVREYAEKNGGIAIKLCAKIEEEMVGMEDSERAEFLASLGASESGLEQSIREGFSRLGLISYFTAGVKEVRAWTIRRGDLAPKAASVIHKDFEKGFIRAECISYDDFIKYGGEAKVKEAGAMRIEGKEYIVEDGDRMHFRFNV